MPYSKNMIAAALLVSTVLTPAEQVEEEELFLMEQAAPSDEEAIGDLEILFDEEIDDSEA